MLSIVLLLLASYTSSLHAWWQQRSEIETKKSEIAALKTDIGDIDREFSRWSDAAYVEQQARARFGWVMPGEVGYRVLDKDGKVKGEAPVLGAVPEAERQEWYDQIWGTTVEAGKDPKEKERLPEADPDKILNGEEDD